MIIMAALPILLLLVLMLAFHWSASSAAAVSMACSMAVAVAFYGGNLQMLAVESAKGIWSSFTILIVVFPAILIYEVASEANAFEPIRSAIERFCPNMLLQILAIGWVFSSFLQGVTGFGVPVAVVAPLLIAMGLEPVWAVIIPLLGQAWGNTYGTLAAAWDALKAQATLDSAALMETAFLTALLLFIVNLATGVIICLFYGKGKALKKGLPAVLLISLIQGGGEVLLCRFNTSLCCFLPACVSLCAVLLIGRLKFYREPWSMPESPMMSKKTAEVKLEAKNSLGFHQAFLPYYTLTAITVIVLLIPAVKKLCSGVVWSISFPATKTSLGIVNGATDTFSTITPFTNSGVFLLIAAIVGYIYYRAKGCYRAGSTGKILKNLSAKTMPSALTIIMLVVMSRIMSGSGQIYVLAQATASASGKVYGLLAPFIGLLGTFVTGSNVSSNVMFTQFQQGIADITGLSAAWILAAQTAGASLGSMISPGKLILGTTTAGILGQEESIMKKVLPFALAVCLVVGVLTLIFA